MELENDASKQLQRKNQWHENIPIRPRGVFVPDEIDVKHSIEYASLAYIFISMIIRFCAVIMNLILALHYYQNGHFNWFMWTCASIIIPIVVTSLIKATMVSQDCDLNNETYKVPWLTIILSALFRYSSVLYYAFKCKRAEFKCDIEARKKFKKLKVLEESDVAFISIFDCFLEAAPQKILQITIVLTQSHDISNWQIVVICGYFGTMAWCLSNYHRCNRYVQIDKHKMDTKGFVLQLCWHFFVSVSRILCLSLIASLFPLWTLFACIMHSLFFGLLTFLLDHPQFCATSLGKFLFCMILGFVYLFTYIMAKDGRTRNKYIIYYTLNSLENIACVGVFIFYSSDEMRSSVYFYPLCIISVGSYYIGIFCMVLYYTQFHPKITARSLKLIIN